MTKCFLVGLMVITLQMLPLTFAPFLSFSGRSGTTAPARRAWSRTEPSGNFSVPGALHFLL